MRRLIKSILPMSSHDPTRQSERQKISYWYDRLFHQGKGHKTHVSISNQIPFYSKIEQSTEQKGVEEAVKNHAGEAEKSKQTVADMVSKSNRVLLKISSVFPWDFFPSNFIVEETRITIIDHQLFSSQVHSVDIKDISNIFIDTSILFAQLTIISNTFAKNQIIINRLWKKDAILMRRIIEGLRMFVNKDIDTTEYKVEELVNKLKQLSTTGIDL